MIEMLIQADRLLTVDLIDQADAIYRRVADQDPRNAIAVVGLARCALARGEDQEAYRLAARAQDIDPENDMARRMTARMAEVLAYRDDPLPDVAATLSDTASQPPATPPVPDAAMPVAPAALRATGGRSWLDRIRGR